MRRILFWQLALLACGGMVPVAAHAGMATPDFSWAGPYVGGTVGYAWGTADVGTQLFYDPPIEDLGNIDTAEPPFSSDLRGLLGGAEVGVNAQWQNFVAGIEGDWSATGIRGSVDNTTFGYTAKYDMSWLASIRGRFGVAFGRTLLFATAGVAFANGEAHLKDDLGGSVLNSSASNLHIGYIVGGGAEFAVTDHWTIKAEYLYFNGGSKDYRFHEASPGDLIVAPITISGSLVRIGANYKF